MVILPDQFHALWRLPEGNRDFSLRWALIKSAFSRRYGQLTSTSFAPPVDDASRLRRREVTIWQRRFWEHAIRDDDDLRRHLDYIWYNPVKHGLVSEADDWPHLWCDEYRPAVAYDPVKLDGQFGES